jgi:L-fuconolactonase
VIIDAHLHVWDLAASGYPWLGPALAPIDRTFEFDEIRPALDRAGVSGVILVQADDTDADTEHMLAVAAATPEVVGVVGWVPLDDPDRTAERLSALRGRGVVGIRTLIHDRPDPDWILHPEVAEGLDLVAAAGLPYDYVTASPAALRHLPTLGERHPALRLVIDHLGKPPIGGTEADRREWRRLIDAAAQNPSTHAKLSGLYAAAGSPEAWTVAELRPFVDAAIEAFGPERLMYGGDWPVSIRAGGHDRVLDGLRRGIAGLDEAGRRAVFTETAARFYGVETGPEIRPEIRREIREEKA